MTTNDKIYSVAEPNIYSFNQENREALIEKYKDLSRNVKDYKLERGEFNKQLINHERELADVKDSIEVKQNEIDNLKNQYEGRLKSMHERTRSKASEMVDKLKEEQDDIIREKNNLQKQVTDLEEFEKNEPLMRMENERLRKELQQELHSLKLFSDKILEQKQQLNENMKKDYKKIERMKNDIKALEKNTQEGKVNFAHMKKVNYMQVDKTRAETQDLMQKSKNFKIEKIVSNDCLSEYQNLNYKQSKRITSLKNEVQYIKYRLSEELYQFASQLEILKKDRTDMESLYKEKIQSLAEHINLKTNEVNNLRFLTKTILYQKTELDKFFLETIDHIKRAMEDSYTGSRIEAKAKNLKPRLPFSKYGALHWENETFDFKSNLVGLGKDFNDIREGKKIKKKVKNDPDSISQKSKNLADKRVDLTDLDWDEKEKIIRILYTKINMGVTPSYWRQIEMMVQNREEDDDVEYEVDYEQPGDDFEYPVEGEEGEEEEVDIQ